ncbi:hypothetical protein BH10PSE7_BH10PSE7_40360 [soil metagenome]
MNTNATPAARSAQRPILRAAPAWLGDAGFMLSAGVIVLMIIAAVSAYLSIQMNQRAELGRDANELHVINLRLNNRLTDAETAQRGYLLTADSSFLAAYREAESRLPELTTKLVELTLDDASQQVAARQAAELARRRIADLSRAIDLQMAGKPTDAIQQIRGEYGYRNLDELRTILDGLTASAERTADQGREEARRGRTWLMSVTLIGLLLSAALSVLAVRQGRRRMRDLRAEHQSLTDLNAVLEERVRARTEELVSANAAVERERDQANTLLADVNHRIGNNLQLVSSMLGMHARMAKGDEARSVLQAARSQVHSIASAQRRLRMIAGTDQVEIASFLETLIQDVRDTISRETPVTIETDIAPAVVTSKTAVSLGAIVNELISNAIKHGYPAGRRGTIRISAAFGDNDEIGSFVVEDDGIGATPERDDGSGLGGKIVRALAQTLDSDIVVEPKNPGAEFPGTRIRFVKSRDSESAAA